ncbi:MAG TPA: PhzF family phenazine biosynthesis protein [Steroidobacteraceae bacterium]|nr:PhzF family phenazine biosynthesis protein [Steroidobacteraceae bacterium]
MEYPIYQVDAFTERRFHGNPAAVVISEEWLAAEVMQAVAAENNLAETAFLVREGARFGIRWFTPTVEIDLCGHATLASAHVLFEQGYTSGDAIELRYGGGVLNVTRDGERLALDFPSLPPTRTRADSELGAALGALPDEAHIAKAQMAVYASAKAIRALEPDMTAVAKLEGYGLIVTAPGDDCDFVSRFFAPQSGVPEDPVTGSAHCTLIPYWSKRLGKTRLHARQISPRGGELWCEDRGERVTIAGFAASYLKGSISI